MARFSIRMRGLVLSHRTLFDDIFIDNSFSWLMIVVFWLLKISAHWEAWTLSLEWGCHSGVHKLLRHEVLSLKLAIWRALEVDEEVLGDVLHIVVMDIIII